MPLDTASSRRRWYRPATEPLPPEPGRLVVCALLGRARAARGCSTPGDDRLETRVYAVKRYLFRLGHASRSARYATSIAQLVVGLAPVMGWGPVPRGGAARARFVRAHRRSVQRWLDDLEAAGLIVHEPERDDGGRWWRTQIVLQRAPEPSAHELEAARRRASRWRARERARRRSARRAPALGAIRDRSAIPTARTRARLAVARSVDEHERRRRAAVEAALARRDLTHPFGAPPPSALLSVSAKRWRRPETSQVRVPATPLAARAASMGETVVAETGAHERENEFAERLAALRRAAAERAALLAPQVEARTLEARHWPAGQRCPLGRLREAWVVHRYGLARAIDTGGASAGRVSLDRVGRAVGLYEAFAAHRPPGLPTSGAAALCVLAVIGRADRLAGDVANLQRLAMGMRAVAVERDPVRLARDRGRAERRRDGRRAPARSIAFRMGVARAETAERRRRRVRDLVLLAGGNPASWPNAELALRHLRALAGPQPRLMEPDRFEELDGIGARATRYRDELACGHWRLPEVLDDDHGKDALKGCGATEFATDWIL